MKRDWNIIRQVVLDLEEGKPFTAPTGAHLWNAEARYHLDLITQAGWVCFRDGRTLTMEGHDFADLCRDEKDWVKVQDAIRQLGGLTYEMVLKILVRSKENLWRDLNSVQ